MPRDSSRPKAGIIATMTELYRSFPDIRPRMERWAAELTASMGEFTDVVFPGICDTREAVERACEEIRRQGAELLMVLPLTYAESHLVLPTLRSSPLPLLLLNSQILFEFDAGATGQPFIDNQAPTGFFDLSNVLVRTGIPFQVASGYQGDLELMAELRDWCRVAHVAAQARRLRVGLAGYSMDGMGDLAVDHTLLLGLGGAEVVHVPVPEIGSRAEAAPAEEVRRMVDDDRRLFDVDPGLRAHEHELSSRLEHALRAIVRDHRLDAFTFHFTAVADDGRIRTLPVLGASKLLAEGVGYAGEGDVTCAALVTVLARLAGESEFFETWGLDFASGSIMKNHMGEGNYRLARKDLPVKLVRAPIGLGDEVAPAVPRMVMRPGEATLANLTTGRGGVLKLTVCEGAVPDMAPIAGVLTPHGKFTPSIPLKEFLERFALAGGSHHSALAYGRWARSLGRLAWIMGWEFECIGPVSASQPPARRNSW